MATFYPGYTDQKDVMPNLYARDPGHATYPDPSGNMLYLSYPSSGPYPETLAGSSQSQQNCVELPVPTSMASQDSSVGGVDLFSSRINEHTYNAWRDGRNEMLFMQTIGGSVNGAHDLVRTSGTDEPQMDLQPHLGILNGQSMSLSDVSTMQGQGLSLSLSTQIPVPSFQYRPGSMDISFVGSHQPAPGNGGASRDDNSRCKDIDSVSSTYVLPSVGSSIPNSKYLKPAQQLLDEVVNVRQALKHKADKSQSSAAAGCKENDGGSKTDGNAPNTQESTCELSPSERQDLQNKVTKLLAMLDEVDRRYKQYYHQMQIVVSSFDAIAGYGAAKPYTALALQTISRHFRCLRDAISGQIRGTRKSLGEQDTSCKGVGISRLRFIDQHLRQQRAMQQFGMMQPHAWRPQRGLPETSVTILRAWLFEHFLHPYPKDSEKLMLARQTGLTRSQVANWFINARVRLWKPMIEEMYKEENGFTGIDSNSSSGNTPKAREEIRSSADREDLQSPTTEMCHTSQFNDSSKSALNHDVDMGSVTATGFHTDQNTDDAYRNIKVIEQRPSGEDCALSHDERFMAYQMAELGRYGNNNVSLTLGLQHCDGGQQSFLGVRGEEMYDAAPTLEADEADYEYINVGGRQHQFNSSQLLHDFVT